MRLSFGGDEAILPKQQEHCICGNRRNRTAFMICCDYCDVWYHSACVQITRVWADRIEKYSCPLCISLSPSRTTIYKNGEPVTPKRAGRQRASGATTPMRKSPSLRKSATAGTPTRRTNRRKVDFEDNNDGLTKSGHQADSGQPAAAQSMPSSTKAITTEIIDPTVAIASRTTSALLTATRFSLSPEKPPADADGGSCEKDDGPPTLIVNYIARTPLRSRIGSEAETVFAAASVVDDGRSEQSEKLDSGSCSPPTPLAAESAPLKYLEDDDDLEATGVEEDAPTLRKHGSPHAAATSLYASPSPMAINSPVLAVATSSANSTLPITPTSLGVGDKQERYLADTSFASPQRPSTSITAHEAELIDRPAASPSPPVSSGDEKSQTWSVITPVDNRRRRRRQSSASYATTGEPSPGAAARAVLTGYFSDFRLRNRCAARLNEFLLADDSDAAGADSDDDEAGGSKHHHHRHPSRQRNPLLERRVSHLSMDTSPDKKICIAQRQLINIPETPEEKLRMRSALADVSTNGNAADDSAEEIVPQTPIGKIRRESITGKSRLDVLLKENDCSGGEPTVSSSQSRKRARSSHSIVAAANSAKRSLFR